ncbi:unnamed protein product [Cochlearia groenlandica]
MKLVKNKAEKREEFMPLQEARPSSSSLCGSAMSLAMTRTNHTINTRLGQVPSNDKTELSMFKGVIDQRQEGSLKEETKRRKGSHHVRLKSHIEACEEQAVKTKS